MSRYVVRVAWLLCLMALAGASCGEVTVGAESGRQRRLDVTLPAAPDVVGPTATIRLAPLATLPAPTAPAPLPSATSTIAPVPATRTPAPPASATLPRPTRTVTPLPLATATPLPGELATVVDIVDGDTIAVSLGGVVYRLRYIGIDTPEYNEPCGTEAAAANVALVAGQTVRLVRDVSETDRYDRLLRYVYVGERFVNAALVSGGWAVAVAYPPDTAFVDELEALEREAERAGLGCHALGAFDPPPPATVPPTPMPTAAPLPTATLAPLPTATQAPVPTEAPAPTEAPPPVAAGNVQITGIYYDGQVPRVESDEYAVITNLGGTPVNLAGWRLNADDPGQDFWFPAFDLAPGQSCRVYTNEIHPEHCGFSFGNGQALWNNSDHECGHLFDASGVEVSTFCY